MYLIKLRYKNDKEIKYANKNVIQTRTEARINLDWYKMTLDNARKLMRELISKNNEVYEEFNLGWYSSQESKLDFICIVELSNYYPYNEYEILDYKEFK